MHPLWHNMLAEQLPSGATQEQSCSVKAGDETARVEAKSRTKTDMKPATSRFFIESLPLSTATNRTQYPRRTLGDRMKAVAFPTPFRDGLRALVAPDRAGREAVPNRFSNGLYCFFSQRVSRLALLCTAWIARTLLGAFLALFQQSFAVLALFQQSFDRRT